MTDLQPTFSDRSAANEICVICEAAFDEMYAGERDEYPIEEVAAIIARHTAGLRSVNPELSAACKQGKDTNQ